MSERMDEHIYYIWLSLAGGVNCHDYSLLLDKFGSAEKIYNLGIKEYSEVDGLNCKLAQKLEDKNLDASTRIYKFCQKHKVRLLHCMESDYPIKLKWTYAYPVLLYVFGELPNLNECLSVAVVGTRSYSEYGRIATYKIAGGLAKAKTVVVSGLALGNDGFAHDATLKCGGKTVAVMGNGIDMIYPSCHRELAKEICKNGCILTEFPPGEKPLPYHFPIRNRIISGLSDAVVLVEAKEKSGALITTKFATEQSRTVFAVPGEISSKSSAGPLSLLKDGAKPVSSAKDIIEDFVCQYSYLKEVLQTADFDVDVPPDYAYTNVNGNNLPTRENRSKSKKLIDSKIKKRSNKKLLKEDMEKGEPPKLLDKNGIRKDETGKLTPADGNTPDIGGLDGVERQIYERLMQDKCLGVDALAQEIPSAEVLAALTMLEIKGYVKALPGGMYSKA